MKRERDYLFRAAMARESDTTITSILLDQVWENTIAIEGDTWDYALIESFLTGQMEVISRTSETTGFGNIFFFPLSSPKTKMFGSILKTRVEKKKTIIN